MKFPAHYNESLIIMTARPKSQIHNSNISDYFL